MCAIPVIPHFSRFIDLTIASNDIEINFYFSKEPLDTWNPIVRIAAIFGWPISPELATFYQSRPRRHLTFMGISYLVLASMAHSQ